MYNLSLVLLSIFAATQAGYVGLNLAQRIPSAFALHRRLLIAGSAITLAVGVWSMHFIGLLALSTTASIDYLVLPTLISFLVCILVTGISIYMASLRSVRMTCFGALFMGLGIASMHFIGMMALHSSIVMTQSPAHVVASLLFAIFASGVALWMAFLANARFPVLIGSVVFGAAVSGMHYTAMAGMTTHVLANPTPSSPFISGDVLAIIVSIVAFSISAIFMLTLVPKRNGAERNDDVWNALENATPEPIEMDLSPEAHDEDHRGNEALPPSAFLPIDKHGSQFQIAAKDIMSVHANAHYTYIFNGRDDFFCSLSISEVAERLGSTLFFRTHRSYIVNLDAIERIQKSGDAALIELRGTMRRNVPVARARVAALRSEWSNYKLKLKEPPEIGQ